MSTLMETSGGSGSTFYPPPPAGAKAGNKAGAKAGDHESSGSMGFPDPVSGPVGMGAAAVGITAGVLTLDPAMVVAQTGALGERTLQAATLGAYDPDVPSVSVGHAHRHRHAHTLQHDHPYSGKKEAAAAGRADPDDHCFFGPNCEGCSHSRCAGSKKSTPVASAPEPKTKSAGGGNCPWNKDCADRGGCPACSGGKYAKKSCCSGNKERAGNEFMGSWTTRTECACVDGDCECHREDRIEAERERDYYSARAGYGKAEAQASGSASQSQNLEYTSPVLDGKCVVCFQKVAGGSCPPPCQVTRLVDKSAAAAESKSAGAAPVYRVEGAHNNGACITCSQTIMRASGKCPCGNLRVVKG
jgi:hypothetical protein